MNSNSNIYCPPHLRPGFNQNSQTNFVNGSTDQEPQRPYAHDELIKYISDAWANVINQYGKNAYHNDGEEQEKK